MNVMKELAERLEGLSVDAVGYEIVSAQQDTMNVFVEPGKFRHIETRHLVLHPYHKDGSDMTEEERLGAAAEIVARLKGYREVSFLVMGMSFDSAGDWNIAVYKHEEKNS